MTDRHSIVCASYLILLRQGSGGQVLRRGDEVLLLERKNSGWMDGWYTFPAGHVEHNESPRTCMVREAREEIGIVVKPEDLRLVHVMSRPDNDPDRIDFYFMAEKWEGEPENIEPEKCGGLVWPPIPSLPDNLIPSLRQALDGYLSGTAYSERTVES